MSQIDFNDFALPREGEAPPAAGLAEEEVELALVALVVAEGLEWVNGCEEQEVVDGRCEADNEQAGFVSCTCRCVAARPR